jgi:multicomponent Na+:H+ antiporter subunit G
VTPLEWGQTLVLLAGVCFFVVGTLGVLRFPDVYTRLHAITKADNLGLGLVVLALLPSSPSPASAIKLLFVWALVLAASATSGHLIARRARARGVRPVGTDGIAATVATPVAGTTAQADLA